MAQLKNNQEFYKKLDVTCLRLREVGMDTEANRISHLLHKVAWTSTTELFEGLGAAFQAVLSDANAVKLTPLLKEDLVGYITLLAKA